MDKAKINLHMNNLQSSVKRLSALLTKYNDAEKALRALAHGQDVSLAFDDEETGICYFTSVEKAGKKKIKEALRTVISDFKDAMATECALITHNAEGFTVAMDA